ncbi:hypothetical protein BJ165DRAFT_341073 [Panaeolus papilionaceus]|nr:hypothetical protein BJ165DRAFT_341073 [Panaeolus papilionaceus]
MFTSPDFETKLKFIKILGAVSIERVSKVEATNGTDGIFVFVLLGPTGSGKSRFIEAVASNSSLGLSSDKLEGFTQTVSIYRIINAVTASRSPIYLVDIPGFADSKISAMSIVSMLKGMIQTNPNFYFFRILYHTPINNPRLPGSQRKVLHTFEALTGPLSAGKITIISTMWDLIWNENTRRRAEGNFSQLRNEIWKDYIARGADIVKFHNTPESALTILDDACKRGSFIEFSIRTSIHLPLRETRFASYMYDDLQTRIRDLELRQASIQSELQMTTAGQSAEELKTILGVQLKEVQTLITKFEEELRELGTPADQRPVTQKLVPPTDDPALTMPGAIPTPGPIISIPESSAPAPEPVALAPHAVVFTLAVEPFASIVDAKSRKGGIFARATNKVKGWGERLLKHRTSD